MNTARASFLALLLCLAFTGFADVSVLPLAGGISAGVDRIIRVVDGESLPAPAPRQQQSSDFLSHVDLLNPFTLFAVFIVSTILRTTLGRLIGAVATGGIVGALAWLIAGSLAASFIAA